MFRPYVSICCTLAVLAGSQSVKAADWPTASVTIIVPYTPGNMSDIAARVVAQKLSERTQKPFIVENKAGAGTQIGTDLVARAKPDGHTLLVTGAVFATNPALFEKLPYDSGKDFAPVGLVVSAPLVLVTAKSKPFQDFGALVSHAKTNPGRLTVASGGNGTLSHMAMALMAANTGTEMVHVAYKGGSAAATDTLSGQVDAMWDNLSPAIPHIRTGRLRPLAVSSRQRSLALPSVPAVAEISGSDFEVINWFGMFAPANTAPDLLDEIHR
jgi:tripartite-type tricarboxylate transporter receptor subunit TctC